jgi:hypothetical protein
MATKLMSTPSCVEIKDYIIKLRYKLKTEEKKKKKKRKGVVESQMSTMLN